MSKASNRRAALLGLMTAAFVSGCDIADPFRVLTDDRAVERVVVTPETFTAAIRDTVELTARALGAGDREIAEAEIVWSSGDPSIARSLSGGRFVLLSGGTAEVFATTRGRRGTAQIVAR